MMPLEDPANLGSLPFCINLLMIAQGNVCVCVCVHKLNFCSTEQLGLIMTDILLFLSQSNPIFSQHTCLIDPRRLVKNSIKSLECRSL
ncbi:hypothetical protein CLU79DRAFT_729805 [Phycomyces nitens]|nr:hypothetical protein CLU79DRAFT_729805 [Phycomyces nitens]